jgi:hypothetical protein
MVVGIKALFKPRPHEKRAKHSQLVGAVAPVGDEEARGGTKAGTGTAALIQRDILFVDATNL